MRAIIEVIRNALEETPAELSADLVDRGIVLAGGGSLLRGFPELITQETELPANLAEDPLTCVVRGTGKYLEELDHMHSSRRFIVE
jgi:rod shape-determining protein MreB